MQCGNAVKTVLVSAYQETWSVLTWFSTALPCSFHCMVLAKDTSTTGPKSELTHPGLIHPEIAYVQPISNQRSSSSQTRPACQATATAVLGHTHVQWQPGIEDQLLQAAAPVPGRTTGPSSQLEQRRLSCWPSATDSPGTGGHATTRLASKTNDHLRDTKWSCLFDHLLEIPWKSHPEVAPWRKHPVQHSDPELLCFAENPSAWEKWSGKAVSDVSERCWWQVALLMTICSAKSAKSKKIFV